MQDVFGTASAALGLLDQILRLIHRAKGAAVKAKDLPEVLDTYGAEVSQTKTWLELVTTDEGLQQPGLFESLAKIKKLAERLQDHLQKMNAKRNAVQQFLHQFSSGTDERTLLDKLVHDMALVKIDLIVRVQLVLLGITKSIQSAVTISAAAIKAMDAKLPTQPSPGPHPKLVKLLDKKKPNGAPRPRLRPAISIR